MRACDRKNGSLGFVIIKHACFKAARSAEVAFKNALYVAKVGVPELRICKGRAGEIGLVKRRVVRLVEDRLTLYLLPRP